MITVENMDVRNGWDYEQLQKFDSHAGQPGNRDGVPLNTE
jgi:hypothetical protein